MSWSISIISQPMAWRSGLATRGSPACCGGPLEASVAGKSENSAGSFTRTSILLEPQNHTARRAATLVKRDLWSKNDRLSAVDPLGPSRLGVLRTTAPDPVSWFRDWHWHRARQTIRGSAAVQLGRVCPYTPACVMVTGTPR